MIFSLEGYAPEFYNEYSLEIIEMKWKIMLTYGLKYNFFVIGQKWTIIYWLDSFYANMSSKFTNNQYK